jgi:hypothetical protein
VAALTQIFATGTGRAQYQQALAYLGQWLSHQPGNDADVGRHFFDLDRQFADLDVGVVSDLLRPAKPKGRPRESYSEWDRRVAAVAAVSAWHASGQFDRIEDTARALFGPVNARRVLAWRLDLQRGSVKAGVFKGVKVPKLAYAKYMMIEKTTIARLDRSRAVDVAAMFLAQSGL